MNNGGDAAEQIVRLSLEGFEVAVRLTGSAAKNIAILLASVLKQEISQSNKTRGKARLTNMIKSGKELKVFFHSSRKTCRSLPNRQNDTASFTAFCVIKTPRAIRRWSILSPVRRTLRKSSVFPTALNLVKSIRLPLFPKRKKMWQTVKRLPMKCLRNQGARSSWKKRWESQCRRRKIPTKTPRSQRRTKALCPSETQKRQVRTLIRVSQRRRIRSLRSRKSSTDTRRLPKRKKEAERTVPEVSKEKPKTPEANRQTVHRQPKKSKKPKER